VALFIAAPWLALIPAVLFLAAYAASRRSVVLATAVLWVLYTLYELGMKHRLLCGGECNIRVDLLLIYPVLAVLSLVAAIVALRAVWRRAAGT
jgi:hypothetical protein